MLAGASLITKFGERPRFEGFETSISLSNTPKLIKFGERPRFEGFETIQFGFFHAVVISCLERGPDLRGLRLDVLTTP